MSSTPFGVELPENLEAPAAESTESPAGAANKAETTTEPRVHDLDASERVRFQGKEMSREELTELIQKAQNPEPEASKFDRAFKVDLDVVLKDPSRLADFKSVYPPEYVQLVERLLTQQRTTTQTPPGQQTDEEKLVEKLATHPKFQRLFQTAEKSEQQEKQARIQGYERQLDTAFGKLAKKFPEADPEVINSRCLALSQQGVQLLDAKGQVKDAILEKLFKQDHDKRNAYYEQKYRSKVDAQKKANSNSRDMGTGGSASSPAGVKHKTMKEATAALLADLEAAR